MRNCRNKIIIGACFCCAGLAAFGLASIFFDQAVLTRSGTTYHVPVTEKAVALTFDDGPSSRWTPAILDELKKEGVKATFFMLGRHVREFPAIARRVAEEGHEIGNHTYDHKLLLLGSLDDLRREIGDCEKTIGQVTGKRAWLFRPPKAWLTTLEKKEIRRMGYAVVLWSLNSKDWVTFDDRYIIPFLVRRIRPGDIILFHDSGGVFGVDGGDRQETVKTLGPLIRNLRARGFACVTVSELISRGESPQERSR